MRYFTRILSPQAQAVDYQKVLAAMPPFPIEYKAFEEEREADGWTELLFIDKNDEQMFAVDRIAVGEKGAGRQILDELAEEAAQCMPRSGARWLAEYFRKVKTIYAFEHLGALGEAAHFDVLAEFRALLWEQCGGVFQADYEGYTNEEGFYILWQFDDGVDGEWYMAVQINGEWKQFSMDIADPQNRKSFLEGKIPKAAKPVED